jgi:hypothetical protein
LEQDGQNGVHLVWTGNQGIFHRHWQAGTGWAETVKLGRGLVTADVVLCSATARWYLARSHYSGPIGGDR